MSNVNGFSYNFTDPKRDVNEAFMTLVELRPTLLSLIGVGMPARAAKHEWNEDQIAAVKAVATAAVDGSDNFTVSLADAARFAVGDILRITASGGDSETEQVRILTIVLGTGVITVSRAYGGTASTVMAAGQIFFRLSNPQTEGSEAPTGNAHQPTMASNFIQIFDENAKVTKTSQDIGIYGLPDAMNKAVATKLVAIDKQVNSALVYGRKVERSVSADGSMGGILQFLTDAGSVQAVGGALDADALNTSLESIYLEGATSRNLALVCGTKQARVISGFNLATGSSRQTMVAASDRTTGNKIEQFVGDLPVEGGFTANVVVDPSFPQDQLAILDLDKIRLNFLRNFAVTDSTPNGADYFQSRILGELTCTVENAGESHQLLTGLT